MIWANRLVSNTELLSNGTIFFDSAYMPTNIINGFGFLRTIDAMQKMPKTTYILLETDDRYFFINYYFLMFKSITPNIISDIAAILIIVNDS